METDADGKYVKYETDADGFLVKDETISSSHASTTAVETDATGNPVETESRNNHKNNETSASESGIADTKVTDRPGSTSEAALHPIREAVRRPPPQATRSTTTPTTRSISSGKHVPRRLRSAAHPGSTGESTTSGSGSTVPTAASHPGSSTAPTSAASHPGSSSTTPTGAGSGNLPPEDRPEAETEAALHPDPDRISTGTVSAV